MLINRKHQSQVTTHHIGYEHYESVSRIGSAGNPAAFDPTGAGAIG